MEKTIGAFEARRSFGKILQDVSSRGDKFVVERHGEAIAVVVPVEVYAQWKRARSEFFARLRAIAEKAGEESAEAERLAADAVQSTRITCSKE